MPARNDAYPEYVARCHKAFRPFAPIDLPDFFKGRSGRVQLLVSELQAPGRQVAIFGERGVGKTSLAKLAYFFADFPDETSFLVRCQQQSRYETIFGQFLRWAGREYLPESAETEVSTEFGVKASRVSATKGKKSREKHRVVEAARSINPDILLSLFKDQEGLLIIDEYDRVLDESTHTKLAETLKHFSDEASRTKIIIVGVAETLTDLIGEHESITRCLAQVELKRMNESELREIIETGVSKVAVAFPEEIKQKIVILSDGFPFYTHLLCLYCAEEAGKVLLEDPDASIEVKEPQYRQAIGRAIETAEHSLRDDYRKAIITVKRKTEMYKYVMWGVAYSQSIEVQVKEIAQNIGLLTGDKPSAAGLSNYLGPLTKLERNEVLTRVIQGYYKFSNPLMRAYIRLVLEEHNIVDAQGQLKFPWMRPLSREL